MRWLKPTLNSLYGLLGPPAAVAEQSADRRLEDVRKAMLDALSFGDLSQQQHHAVRRIFYADTIQTLWYLRTDVMVVLSGECGEGFAREKMDAISGLFEGLLPEAASFRRAPNLR